MKLRMLCLCVVIGWWSLAQASSDEEVFAQAPIHEILRFEKGTSNEGSEGCSVQMIASNGEISEIEVRVGDWVFFPDPATLREEQIRPSIAGTLKFAEQRMGSVARLGKNVQRVLPPERRQRPICTVDFTLDVDRTGVRSFSVNRNCIQEWMKHEQVCSGLVPAN